MINMSDPLRALKESHTIVEVFPAEHKWVYLNAALTLFLVLSLNAF